MAGAIGTPGLRFGLPSSLSASLSLDMLHLFRHTILGSKGGFAMKYTHTLLLLALMGWLMSGVTSTLAQETSPLRVPWYEDTTLNPSVPPTPRFLQVEVDIGT